MANAERRVKILKEILSTEGTYVNSLTSLIENFKVPMNFGKILSDEHEFEIFLNAEAILGLHKPLLEKLDSEIKGKEAGGEIQNICVGKIMLEIVDWLRIYVVYINGHQTGTDLIEKLNKTDDNFRYALIGLCAENFTGILGLNSLRLVPVQRIPRYVLLLKDLLQNTEEDHPDKIPLEKALAAFQKIAVEINEKKRDAENRAKVQHYDLLLKGSRSSIIDDCPEVQSHDWNKVRIASPTTCSHLGCKGVIGFAKKYYRCSVCHATCHSNCRLEMPANCGETGSLIKHNRILIKDGMLTLVRMRANTGKKSEQPHNVQALLFSDCLLCCTGNEKFTELEIFAVIWWYSLSAKRSAKTMSHAHDTCGFSISSPSDGDIYNFTSQSAEDRDDWVEKIDVTQHEWIESYETRNKNTLFNQNEEDLENLKFRIKYTVPVLGPKGKVFTAFLIDYTSGNKRMSVIKRYSDFVKLHKQLKSAFPKAQLPTLPAKRIFGDNTDKNFVQQRCSRLQGYLNQLIQAHLSIEEHTVVVEFLSTDQATSGAVVQQPSTEATDSPQPNITLDDSSISSNSPVNPSKSSLHKSVGFTTSVKKEKRAPSNGDPPVIGRSRSTVFLAPKFGKGKVLEDYISDYADNLISVQMGSIVTVTRTVDDMVMIYFNGQAASIPKV